MKKSRILTSVILTIIGAFVLFTMSGCKKYENSGISLRTRNERVSNTWRVENYKVNGNDFTSLVSDYTETFTNDGTFSYKWGSIDGIGSWVFQNNDKEIKLSGSEFQTSRTLVILKLEEKTFWYYYMDGNDRHDLHLVQK